MFYGLATNKVQVPGLRFSHTLCDIQSLNQKAMEGDGLYDVTAVSFHVFPYIQGRYALMTCGGSVGEGYGPMVVATRAFSTGEIKGIRIAVPGKLTTAYLALQLFSPGIETEVVPFDEIIPSVVEGKYEAGLIIHEGQLTYDKAGLYRIVDLGRWWQQVTGEAIQGPLKGRRLAPVLHDEVSFGIWKSERPGGRVLRADPKRKDDYESADWERQMKGVRTVTPVTSADPLAPRSTIVGVALNGKARAYPFPRLRAQTPVLDVLGGVPIVLVIGDDQKSIRVFERTLDGRTLELMAKAGAQPLLLLDAETGSEWDFSGRAVSGPLSGRQLTKVKALKEYWFDWKIYQPATTVYARGAALPR